MTGVALALFVFLSFIPLVLLLLIVCKDANTRTVKCWNCCNLFLISRSFGMLLIIGFQFLNFFWKAPIAPIVFFLIQLLFLVIWLHTFFALAKHLRGDVVDRPAAQRVRAPSMNQNDMTQARLLAL